MLDSWSNERNFIHTVSETSFPLTATKGAYTIGPGADFNMTRPMRIIDPCFVRDGDDNDYALEILDVQAYGYLVDKDVDGSYPRYLYYDHGYSATSTARIFFWPEPEAGLSTYINTLQPLQSFTSMSETLLMPPGYQRAIETNYAIEASPGVFSASPELIRIAREAKAAIKQLNSESPISRLDYGIVRGHRRTNILWGP
jgi:hypothetical protein